MPLVYKDGESKWVSPWRAGAALAEGWSLSPPEGDGPREPNWQDSPLRKPVQPIRGKTPLGEAQRRLQAELDATERRVIGFQFNPVRMGTPRWVDTDIMGRAVYEVMVDGNPVRYALDTSNFGVVQFVAPATSIRDPLELDLEAAEAAQANRPENDPKVQRLAVDIINQMQGGVISEMDAIRMLNVMGLDPDSIRSLGFQSAETPLDPDFGEFDIDPESIEGINRLKKRLREQTAANAGSDAFARCMAEIGDPIVCTFIAMQDDRGPSGPRYQGPDRGLVEDSVRGALLALTGTVEQGRLQQLTDLYLRDHRRAFGGAAVDPAQSVRELIRSYPDYQRIHALRPESADEMDWIPSQAGQLTSAGVRPEAIDERAIIQAQIGTPLAQAGRSAFNSELVATGRAMPAFFNRFSQAAQASFRRVS